MIQLNKEIYILLLLLLFICLISCQSNFFQKDLPLILGVNEVEVVDFLVIDEWGGFQGDGYILEEYELSKKTIEAFENNVKKELPKKKSDKEWNRYNWNNDSLDNAYEEVVVLGLNYYTDNEKLKKKLLRIRQLIKSKSSYLSFYYSLNKDNPNCVQLFILDVNENKLYAIDHQL